MFCDLRFACRQLAKAPGFSATVVTTLAVAIAACTVVFSVLNTIVLRPLENPDADRVVVIARKPGAMLPSPADFLEWQRRAQSFEALYAYRGLSVILDGTGEAQRVFMRRVTAGYGAVMQVPPKLGRDFLPTEDSPGANKVVIASHRFWRSQLQARNDAIGSVLHLNGEAYTLIGVAADNRSADTYAASAVDVWVPMGWTNDDKARPSNLGVEARLRRGVTLGQAQAELNAITAALDRENPDRVGRRELVVERKADLITRDVKPAMWALFGAVSCVLLIACANVANLLLARASGRQRELSVRAAIGAARGQLVRLLLAESLVLAVIAGALGVVLAFWLLDIVRSLDVTTVVAVGEMGTGLYRLPHVTIDWRVLVFAVGVVAATTVLFGLIPAWLASRIDLNEALKEGGRGSSESRGRGIFRSGLVVVEVALAVLLLAGGALFIRSFAAATAVDPGFEPDGAVTFRYNFPPQAYRTAAERQAFTQALLERLRGLPGVVAAAGGANPIRPAGGAVWFEVDGRPPSAVRGTFLGAAVTPEYFAAIGTPAVHGRVFSEQDVSGPAAVVVVNQALVRLHFPNEDPIGRRLRVATGPGPSLVEIIGVVGDVRQQGPDRDIAAQIYFPSRGEFAGTHFAVVRTKGDPAALLREVKAQVHGLDRGVAVADVAPLRDVLASTLAMRRFTMGLLGVFSLLALAIAAVGIYAVMAFRVMQRTAEIGIRMALGAQERDVLRLVLGHGVRLVAAGLAIGLVGAIAGGRLIQAMLFQTRASDPVALGVVSLLLLAVAGIACWAPARRATKVDPLVALRAS